MPGATYIKDVRVGGGAIRNPITFYSPQITSNTYKCLGVHVHIQWKQSHPTWTGMFSTRAVD